TLMRYQNERLRPQVGRGIGSLWQVGGRSGGNHREGIGRTDQLSERRGCACDARPFDQSAADRGRETHASRRLYGKPPQIGPARASVVVVLVALSLLSTACGHKEAKVSVPAPPAISDSEPAEPETNSESANETKQSPKESSGKPVMVETGLASWYGGPYHKRPASNGEIYNKNAMTAAHRTLPLNSVVRVTNMKTGRSAVVRITDRGPFVQGRILDISEAAAKKIDVWGAGVAMVRIEVLHTPVPLNSGGRWAVQMGAFEKEHTAEKLADHLSHRYQTAKVLSFSSPVGDWWVRVRVQDDDRKRAESVARETHLNEGEIFLVRLD